MLRNHLINQIDLRANIRFVLNPIRDQGELTPMLRLIVSRAVFHSLEKFVRERFHDEGNLAYWQLEH